MARARLVAIVAVATGLLLSGCGTMANLSDGYGPGEKKVFGGVRLDADYGSAYAGWTNHPDGFVYSVYALSTACAMACDLPFSAIGDTLTLPWTLTAAPSKETSHPNKKELNDGAAPESADK
jgi:uncharacterized protein YceK